MQACIVAVMLVEFPYLLIKLYLQLSDVEDICNVFRRQQREYQLAPDLLLYVQPNDYLSTQPSRQSAVLKAFRQTQALGVLC